VSSRASSSPARSTHPDEPGSRTGTPHGRNARRRLGRSVQSPSRWPGWWLSWSAGPTAWQPARPERAGVREGDCPRHVRGPPAQPGGRFRAGLPHDRQHRHLRRTAARERLCAPVPPDRLRRAAGHRRRVRAGRAARTRRRTPAGLPDPRRGHPHRQAARQPRYRDVLRVVDGQAHAPPREPPSRRPRPPAVDPGALAWTGEQAPAAGGVTRVANRHQALLFFPLLTLAGIDLPRSSARGPLGERGAGCSGPGPRQSDSCASRVRRCAEGPVDRIVHDSRPFGTRGSRP
jgi:hypothetical protein